MISTAPDALFKLHRKIVRILYTVTKYRTNSNIAAYILIFPGPLLKEILLHMEEIKRTDSKPKRSYFYSAHDITIVNVLRTMGFTNELFKPDYGATLIFELHFTNNSADQEVKVWLFVSLS